MIPQPLPTHPTFKNLLGLRFHRLLVTAYLGNIKMSGRTKPIWLCVCDCGNLVKLPGERIHTGHTKSCGCLNKDVARERCIKRNRKGFPSKTINPEDALFKKYQKSAKKRKHSWELSKEIFKKLILSNCQYCGTGPSNVYKTINNLNSFLYNGIDRVNNLEGYTLTNSISCCKICNMAKGKLTIEEFLQWVKTISTYQALL